jgi:hypothetical protein
MAAMRVFLQKFHGILGRHLSKHKENFHLMGRFFIMRYAHPALPMRVGEP